ncbi:MAG: hypothetical protein AAFV88_02420 [Planctomycetota bacterium]
MAPAAKVFDVDGNPLNFEFAFAPVTAQSATENSEHQVAPAESVTAGESTPNSVLPSHPQTPSPEDAPADATEVQIPASALSAIAGASAAMKLEAPSRETTSAETIVSESDNGSELVLEANDGDEPAPSLDLDLAKAPTLDDLESAWKDKSIAERLEQEGESLLTNPTSLPAALDFEDELLDEDLLSEELLSEDRLGETPLQTEPPESTPAGRQKVPLADDQRSYYQRHPAQRPGLTMKSVARVVGPTIIALPIIAVIAWQTGLLGGGDPNPLAALSDDASDLDLSRKTDSAEGLDPTEDADPTNDTDPTSDDIESAKGEASSVSITDAGGVNDRDSMSPFEMNSAERNSAGNENLAGITFPENTPDSGASEVSDANASLMEDMFAAREPQAPVGEDRPDSPGAIDDFDSLLQDIKRDEEQRAVDPSEGVAKGPTAIERARQFEEAKRPGGTKTRREPEVGFLTFPALSETDMPKSSEAPTRLAEAPGSDAVKEPAESTVDAKPIPETSPVMQASGESEFVPLFPPTEDAVEKRPKALAMTEELNAASMANPDSTAPPKIDSEPILSVDPEVLAACTRSSESLEALNTAFQSEAAPDVKTRLRAYRDLAQVGAFEWSEGPSPVPELLAKVDSKARASLATLARDWIKYSRRQTDGILLIGELTEGPEGFLLQVDGGDRYLTAVPRRLVGLAPGRVIAVGKILESPSDMATSAELKKVRLTAAISVPE